MPLTTASHEFQDETKDLIRFYADETLEHSARAGSLILFKPNTFNTSTISLPNSNDEQTSTGHELPMAGGTSLDIVSHYHQHSPFTNQCQLASSPVSHRSAHSSMVSPAKFISHFDPFTDREALLMRNFVENMAQWADITDIERHFEIEVPRRALSNLMLRFAIFSFSSRHLGEREGSTDLTEALGYHNHALQLLIPQLSGFEKELDVEIFVAVLILRLDEEWHELDNRFHLAGATRILNSISSFISSGGLGEAAAWLCLRQDIAISVASQQPLRTSLDPFHTCCSIQKDNDLSWALRMVLILGATLTYAFSSATPGRVAKLQSLIESIKTWQDEKPVSYEPIRNVPRQKGRGFRIPVLWMLSPFHVLGTVYYHMAKIVLLTADMHISDDSVGGIADIQHVRRIERSIKEHLLIILGLAISNPRSQNTMYSAMHSLEAWGSVLRHELDQEAAIQFLRFAEDTLGWKMQKVYDKLQNVWNQDKDSE